MAKSKKKAARKKAAPKKKAAKKIDPDTTEQTQHA